MKSPFAMSSYKVKYYFYILSHISYFLCFSFIIHYFFVMFTVPAQENGFDCGLFVCLYASAMYYLQDIEITFADVVKEQPPLMNSLV